MQPKEKEQKGEEVKGSNRLAHLREIELSRQKLWKENHVFEADAEEDWQSKYDFETKNKKKIFNNISLPLHERTSPLRPRFFLIKSRISIKISKTPR